MLWLHQDQTCQTKPCQTEPDGARWSQTKKLLFLSDFLDQTFPGIFGDRLCQTAPDFLFVYLTEGTDWLVSGVPGVKEADRNGQKRSGSVWHGFVWHGWSWRTQSITLPS